MKKLALLTISTILLSGAAAHADRVYVGIAAPQPVYVAPTPAPVYVVPAPVYYPSYHHPHHYYDWNYWHGRDGYRH